MTAAPQTDDGLKPELTLFDSITINVGTMVASAIFLMPAVVALSFRSVAPSLLVWIVGGIISVFGALCLGELGAAMPKAGGQFVYLKRIYGPVWGYLYGWASSVIINPGSIAAIAVGFATYLSHLIPMGSVGVKVAAVVSIMGLSIMNCFGLRLGVVLQNVLTVLKIVAIVGLAALCFLLPGGSAENLQPFWPTESWTSLIGPFGLALVAALFAYDGWIEITYVGSEMRNPARDMPRSIILSTALVALLYATVAVAFTYVLGHQGVGQSPRVAADAATAVLGTAGAVVVTFTVLVSTLGSNNGIVFTAARIPFAMARDGQFFAWAGRVSPRYAVPTTSILVQGVWSSLLALSGTYDQLATYVVFASFLFYGLSAVGVMVLRRREPNLPRPYRSWGYPFTPLVFTGFAAFLIINTTIEQPVDTLIGIGLLAVGLVFYYGFGWHRASARQ